MRLVRPFFIIPFVYREALFRIKTPEKVLFLSFDDGPYPDTTPRIIEILGNYNIKALFFCTGTLAEAGQEIVTVIRSGGHLVGNHGYDHLSGFRTPPDMYYNNVQAAAAFTSEKIFRPPYGQITPSQFKMISRSYKIVFWDVMAYDFDLEFGWEKSFDLLKRMIRNGSIIVFHDKPASSVLLILERFIEHAISKGFRFDLPVDPEQLQEKPVFS
jgi:peptidoglycan/xylan/chitin deacetylase (PgdA/CDA1 family)